jgi:hypothetical protein
LLSSPLIPKHAAVIAPGEGGVGRQTGNDTAASWTFSVRPPAKSNNQVHGQPCIAMQALRPPVARRRRTLCTRERKTKSPAVQLRCDKGCEADPELGQENVRCGCANKIGHRKVNPTHMEGIRGSSSNPVILDFLTFDPPPTYHQLMPQTCMIGGPLAAALVNKLRSCERCCGDDASATAARPMQKHPHQLQLVSVPPSTKSPPRVGPPPEVFPVPFGIRSSEVVCGCIGRESMSSAAPQAVAAGYLGVSRGIPRDVPGHFAKDDRGGTCRLTTSNDRGPRPRHPSPEVLSAFWTSFLGWLGAEARCLQ